MGTNIPSTALTLFSKISASKGSFVVVAPDCNSLETSYLSSLQEATAPSRKPKWSRTEEAKSGENAAKHPVLPPRKDGCNKCKTRLPNDDRPIIDFRFLNLLFIERWQSLSTHVNQTDVKRRKFERNQSRRSFSREYFLTSRDGKTTRACKSMLLSTLGLKSDGIITELIRAQSQSDANTIALIENRMDKHPASHNCDTKAIYLHINSYKSSISQYKCNDAPNKRYLNRDICIKSMYENFLHHKENKAFTYRTYCNIFRQKIENYHFMNKYV